ncbi:MAG TPA: DUF2782 domain-containing protein [Gammaproteobacteria bacterium]|nr:DUF2782 domain-containing protein [Gammaproteobacteria bacterium]
MFNKLISIFILLFLIPLGVNAEEIVPPPVIPEQLQDGMSIEPDIRIISQADRTVKEYRINGQLYMIKVIPEIGYPYLLIDTDGDGAFETTRSGIGEDLLVPNWVLLEW